MIRKYQEWLEESEKVEANPEPAPVDPTTDLSNPASSAALLNPADTDPAAPAPDAEATPDLAAGDSAMTEIEEYKKLDTERKDAIKAFKAKQEEFLQIPEDVRKNPTEEEDKTKVEGLKTELIDLNKKMKEAIAAWDKFNAEVLGIEDDGIDDEP